MFLQGLKDRFKHKSGEKYLKNELLKIPDLERNRNEIKKVGVIVDLDTFQNADLFYQFIDMFNLRPNAVKIMGYRGFYDKNSPYSTPVFSDKDLGWGGAVENSYALEFLTKEYDLLVNYYTQDTLILKLMTVKTKARIKVGFAEIDPELNDLILQTQLQDFNTFKTELKKYLNVMNEL
ncbi:hypothetical protein [uncultured Muriicola sp.]|uniref:DUF6913 domain-containing protein n=1 Tax=uncultured Muriicola sp. TaxID=1583102 RepID=UPI00260D7321|nr:hypothetical protein [uncultured Muriicola sp.]